ncbi:unnamed protein product [Moneuplotes crassus]|uniref:RING-type domain-containing protein n=1 Tax=Euplotes crassus TaxID=5936 RepID=A0AAD1UFZ5_EUPCR|nr:unnamed protein product [Moneuplotes crassus]
MSSRPTPTNPLPSSNAPTSALANPSSPSNTSSTNSPVALRTRRALQMQNQNQRRQPSRRAHHYLRSPGNQQREPSMIRQNDLRSDQRANTTQNLETGHQTNTDGDEELKDHQQQESSATEDEGSDEIEGGGNGSQEITSNAQDNQGRQHRLSNEEEKKHEEEMKTPITRRDTRSAHIGSETSRNSLSTSPALNYTTYELAESRRRPQRSPRQTSSSRRRIRRNIFIDIPDTRINPSQPLPSPLPMQETTVHELCESLKKVEVIETNLKSFEKEPCCICLTKTKIGDTIVILTCTHKFHLRCLKNWIKQKPKCPICRDYIIPFHPSPNH